MNLLEEISASLGVPVDYLANLNMQAQKLYREYRVPKRTVGYRTIHHPAKRLKPVQRWLKENYIDEWPVHDAAMAYRLGINIGHHAAQHAKSRYLLRMDFRNFFPSITREDIHSFLETVAPNWSATDRRVFSRFVCRNDRLTIGAPTSPSLSNAICFNLDENLCSLAQEEGLVYTRYADDIFFSTQRANILETIPDNVTTIVRNLGLPSNLSINQVKTQHSSKKGKRAVTGIILSSDGLISTGRDRKREIRSMVYRFEQLNATDRKKLQGYISFIDSIEPGFVDKLRSKYGEDVIRAIQKYPY